MYVHIYVYIYICAHYSYTYIYIQTYVGVYALYTRMRSGGRQQDADAAVDRVPPLPGSTTDIVYTELYTTDIVYSDIVYYWINDEPLQRISLLLYLY